MRRLIATYRLQLDQEFTFAHARRIAPYLKRLGVSHLYLSPVLRSRGGSDHGYDVVDPTHVDPDLGGERGWGELVADLRDLDMGIVLDIVPNHMGMSPENPFLESVFVHGPASPYAAWFDIDWNTPQRGLEQRMLLPILGDELDTVIRKGEIGVEFEEGRFRVRYHDHVFPVDPKTIPMLLGDGNGLLQDQDGGSAAGELTEVLRHLEALPPRDARRAEELERRRREAPELEGRLAALVRRSDPVREHVEEALRRLSGAGDGADGADAGGPGDAGDGREAGDPRGEVGDPAAERMRSFLDGQPYALAHWRRASSDVNYRRFFNISDLVALRMEDPEVFDRVHERVLGWVGSGQIEALRIDHIDGLRDPRGYLDRLRDAVRQSLPTGRDAEFPLLVEKILSPGERLRTEWPVEGTTGYEFLNDLESLFVSPEGKETIERWYRKYLGLSDTHPGFPEVAYQGKVEILGSSLEADVHRLGRLLGRVLHQERDERDLERGDVTDAIVKLIACLAVYRTYVRAGSHEVHPDDRRWIEEAARAARDREPKSPEVLDLVREMLLLEEEGLLTGDELRLRGEFVERFQQTSGPATAKGVEDTALYRYAPLASLNEVGGEPDRELGAAAQTLHRANRERARDWPSSMVTVDTHDTKRSADVRSRIDVLSEIPEDWVATVGRWREMNALHRTGSRERSAPDPDTEYLLYQTLAGVWPVGPCGALPVGAIDESLKERVGDYLIKAAREAKRATSWTDSDPEFEEGVLSFVDALFDPDRSDTSEPSSYAGSGAPDADASGAAGSDSSAAGGSSPSPFLDELTALVDRIAPAGVCNSLSRALVHLTAPGVPDLYQGGETLRFSLVDPDNRRPVDFERRNEMLEGMCSYDSEADRRTLVERAWDGRLKMFVIHRALLARRADPELFADGAYLPVEAEGPGAAHVFAFIRRSGDRAVLTAVPRRVFSLSPDAPPLGDEVWKETRLHMPETPPASPWRSLLTDRPVDPQLRCAELFEELPVALVRSGQAP